jgi:hypothetical protein
MSSLQKKNAGEVTLDQPFRGDPGIDPGPCQLIYDHLMKENP